MGRATLDGAHHRRELVGRGFRIRIEQGMPAACPDARADIVAARKAEIAVLSQDRRVLRLFASLRQRIIA
jgi:hypothetical protein